MSRALLLVLAVVAGLGAWALLRRPAGTAVDGTQDREPAHHGGQGDLSVGTASEAEGPPPGQPRLEGPPREVKAGGGTLVGRVLRPGGIPAADALVRARSDAAPTRPAVETRSAVDGTFRLVGLPAGLLQVRASWAEEDSQLEIMAFATADTDEVELRLVPRMWELRVRVVDSLGVLVPTFRCRVLTSEANRTARGKAGVAVLKLGADWLDQVWIDPGEQSTFVEVWDARDGEGRALDCGAARVGPIEAQGEELRVSLPTGRALRGRLLRPDGTPAKGVSLLVSVAAGGKDVPRDLPAGRTDVPLEDFSLELTTDDQGRFDCARLSAKRNHSVQVQWTGPDLLPLEHVVGPAEDIGDLHLRAALTVELRVLHADGAPQPGVMVWAVPVDHDPRPTTGVPASRRSFHSDIHGVVTLTGLDPEARYVLDVIPPREDEVADFRLSPELEPYRREIHKAVGLGCLRLPDWRPRPEVVRLPLARPLEGVVEDEDGQPVGSAFVEVRDLHGWRWVAQADADGGFHLPQPPAGPLLLRAALHRVAPGSAAAGALVRIEEEARGDVRLSVALAGSAVVIVRGDRESALDEANVDGIFTLRGGEAVVLRLDGKGWSVAPADVVALATPADEQHAADEAGDAVRCYRIVGLRPGARHAFWQHLPNEGYLYGEIPPAARLLRLRQEPGEAIQLRVRGVAADTVVKIAASDALGRVVRGIVPLDAGEASLDGLPRGAWDVQVTAILPGGRQAERSGRAQTGSVLELDLAAPIR